MPTGPRVLRLFVALLPGAATRDRLAQDLRRVTDAAPGARRVRAENAHVTLVFLGATAEADLPGIEEALRGAARGVVPFRWRIAGLGAFPGPHRPRVVWAGVDPACGGPEVAALAERVRAALKAAGHEGEAEERFHAHLTLARLDSPRATPALERLLTAGTLQDTYNPEVASDLALMVSENDGSGVRYRALATVPFGPTPTSAMPGTRENA